MHALQSSALLSMALALCSVATPVDGSANNRLSKRLEDGQYAANSGGTYNGDEGTYVTSDSVHHYASGVKCWTDYMVVSQEEDFDDRKRASGDIHCGSTAQCSFEITDAAETCEIWSTSMSAGVESKIFNFGVSVGHELQKCSTASVAHICAWGDQKCHWVSTAQQVLVQKGYQRRRCNDNGDYTAWLKDFEHRVPTSFADPFCDNDC
jgi:hypothetical protein